MEFNNEVSNPQQNGGFWGIVKAFIIALLIVLPIRYFVAQPFIVRGISMEPNFEDGDYLIVDEISYYFRKPERGEVVVFRFPKNRRQFFIKRVIGLPGERIEIRDGKIKIFNDSYPDGFYLKDTYTAPGIVKIKSSDLRIKLGPSEYFVLGDNRNFSFDSRIWGALDEKFIVGRVIFRAWPLSEFGTISKYSFEF